MEGSEELFEHSPMLLEDAQPFMGSDIASQVEKGSDLHGVQLSGIVGPPAAAYCQVGSSDE